MNTMRNRMMRQSVKSPTSMSFYIKCDENNNIEFIGDKNREVKCGEIWMAKMSEQDGSIQGGCRPVFIISNDKNNQYSTIVNAIPFTTKMNKRNLPCHVEIWDYEKYGLYSPSTLMVEQTTTILKEKLIHRMGEIADIDMIMRICRAMQIQFPFLDLR